MKRRANEITVNATENLERRGGGEELAFIKTQLVLNSNDCRGVCTLIKMILRKV